MKKSSLMYLAAFYAFTLSHMAAQSHMATQKWAWALDYKSLPSDGVFHHRTKWSNGWFIYLDDDAGAPSMYVFGKSGQVKYSAMIQISGADRMRLEDFAAAPDSTVWACGNATSRAGQRTFFVAHVMDNGNDVRLIQLPSYSPYQLSVSPDGEVWTIGYGVKRDPSGEMHVDKVQDVLRHFNASGKFVASSMPAYTLDRKRVLSGHLVTYKDRLGWYSPANGIGTYVEIAPDMKILSSYQSLLTDDASFVEGFTVTPEGRIFAVITRPAEEPNPRVLCEFDRSANRWVPVKWPLQGHVPRLEGSYGESLVFFGPDISKLDVVDVSK